MCESPTSTIVLSPSGSPSGHSGIGSGMPKYSQSPRSAATGSSWLTRLSGSGLSGLGIATPFWAASTEAWTMAIAGSLDSSTSSPFGWPKSVVVIAGGFSLSSLTIWWWAVQTTRPSSATDDRVERDPAQPRPEEGQRCGTGSRRTGRTGPRPPARRRRSEPDQPDGRPPDRGRRGSAPASARGSRSRTGRPPSASARCPAAAAVPTRPPRRRRRGAARCPRPAAAPGSRARGCCSSKSRAAAPTIASPTQDAPARSTGVAASRCAAAPRRRRRRDRAPRPGPGWRSTPPAASVPTRCTPYANETRLITAIVTTMARRSRPCLRKARRAAARPAARRGRTAPPPRATSSAGSARSRRPGPSSRSRPWRT